MENSPEISPEMMKILTLAEELSKECREHIDALHAIDKKLDYDSMRNTWFMIKFAELLIRVSNTENKLYSSNTTILTSKN